MARAAVKAKQAQKAKAQPAPKARSRGRRKHASGGNPNQQLFFVRMRRSAKPAYLILAVLFAVTFAFLGVGSGSGGLSQLFDNLNLFHHMGTSISAAQKQVAKHPNDPKALRTLITAYEAHGDTNLAIATLQDFTTARPKDASAWSELAGLQTQNAQALVTQYQQAYASELLAAPSSVLAPSGSSSVGKALGTNPIERIAAAQVNSSVTDLASRAQGAFQGAVTAYQKVADLEPHNAGAQFTLAQAAQTAGNNTVAVSAYKRYLKLNPDSSTASAVRQLIKSLTKK
jgi:tetratricopeptide (TPR) repeat protein